MAASRGNDGRKNLILGYMPQLDGLRAIAVLSVLVCHFMPKQGLLERLLPWGWMGVRLFFVLSGFLITGILLACRRSVDAQELTPLTAAKNFYIRRFLRLIPVYYLYLLVSTVALPDIRPLLGWFLTYTQNYYFAGDWEFYMVNLHLWTLSVEEQFYLFWPCFILFVPIQRLLPWTVAAVAFAPLSRIICVSSGMWGLNANLPMTSNLDTLAMGALLAVCIHLDADGRRRTEQFMRLCLWAGLPLMVRYLIWHARGAELWRPGVLAFRELFAGLFFTYVVFRTSVGIGGAAGWVLQSRVMTYLGKISYGLYIYHFHVPGLLREIVLPRLGLSMPESTWARMLLTLFVAIGIAMVSWHLMEKPINGLKRYFPYTGGQPGRKRRNVEMKKSRNVEIQAAPGFDVSTF